MIDAGHRPLQILQAAIRGAKERDFDATLDTLVSLLRVDPLGFAVLIDLHETPPRALAGWWSRHVGTGNRTLLAQCRSVALFRFLLLWHGVPDLIDDVLLRRLLAERVLSFPHVDRASALRNALARGDAGDEEEYQRRWEAAVDRAYAILEERERAAPVAQEGPIDVAVLKRICDRRLRPYVAQTFAGWRGERGRRGDVPDELGGTLRALLRACGRSDLRAYHLPDVCWKLLSRHRELPSVEGADARAVTRAAVAHLLACGSDGGCAEAFREAVVRDHPLRPPESRVEAMYLFAPDRQHIVPGARRRSYPGAPCEEISFTNLFEEPLHLAVLLEADGGGCIAATGPGHKRSAPLAPRATLHWPLRGVDPGLHVFLALGGREPLPKTAHEAPLDHASVLAWGVTTLRVPR